MAWPTIRKPRDDGHRPSPGLVDYAATCATFDWTAERVRLTGTVDGDVNIAHAAVVRHCHEGHGDRVALRVLRRDGARHDITYAGLDHDSAVFAGVLHDLGVAAGDAVFTLLGREPLLYSTVVGTLRHRAVLCPLFAAFGPEPVCQRLSLGHARVLVTTTAAYTRKVASTRAELSALTHVLVTDATGDDVPAGTLSLPELMASTTPRPTVGATTEDTPSLLHFTSGTTGVPKGAQHVHGAVVAHAATGRFVLDLHPDDVYWCTADPGWVTGTSYGIVAPLVLGVTSIVDEGEFDAARWCATLRSERVQVWYTAPTALRMLMRASPELFADGFPDLRFVASVGEPLNPEVVQWGVEHLGMPVHDNWWQTETGGIMIANFRSTDVKPGSMGRPVPGVDAAVLRRDTDGAVVVDAEGVPEQAAADEEGELALRRGWPSMFRGYLDRPDRYAACFVGDWYRTGDLARVDADGWFHFVGRADDVIKSAGHLIGPFEVESALMEHDAVAEVGVIGVPDDVAGQVVQAYVSLRSGVTWDDTLQRELVAFGRRRLGAVAPRRIVHDEDLPKTRSGKIMRRLLRARALGLPEGDVSTLEPAPTPVPNAGEATA